MPPAADQLDGHLILEEAISQLGIDLLALVALASVFASPDVFQQLRSENGLGVWYPNVRRYKRGERKGDMVGNVRLDDNTYGNYAIDGAVGRATPGLEASHVWPLTTYDERYHTCIANIVLLPASIAGLSDKHPGVIAALKYRSFELFDWYPVDIAGVSQQKPERPDCYPAVWRKPEPMTPAIAEAIRRRKPR